MCVDLYYTQTKSIYSCFSSSSLPFRKKNRVGSRVGFSRKRRRISFAPLLSPPCIYSDTLTAYTHTPFGLCELWRGALSLIFISSGERWMCKFDIINLAAKIHRHRTIGINYRFFLPPPPLWLYLVFTFIPFFVFQILFYLFFDFYFLNFFW